MLQVGSCSICCFIKEADSSDSEVELIRPKGTSSCASRSKRQRITSATEIARVPVYSNKVSSSLKLFSDNPKEQGELAEQLKKVQGPEDLDSDGFSPCPKSFANQFSEEAVCVLSDSEEEPGQKGTRTELVRDKSPSPPPLSQVPKRKHGRAYRKIRAVDKTLKALDKFMSSSKPSSQEEIDNDVILVDANVSQDITIKVRRRSSLFRISLQMSDPLQKVVDQMALRLQVDPGQILLLLRDEELPISKSLRALNLTVADIIDCVVLSGSGEQANGSVGESICLRVQGNEKQSHLALTIRRTDPLKMLMDRYREAMGLQSHKVTFLFEGHKLSEKKTPEELGMEHEDIIEIWV
ncbi:NFATC2-interacting protein isoform X2 [Rhinatrema bivittatum]|uniref:NFATC2-interacting protein isoform X2 n=1 Tax=Rhinatrema bivittatum TaxID=194408 RepID=UPI001125D41B|nr:NFATC2-interacting protein isoform X2 [Rhinatrema bivittatum]